MQSEEEPNKLAEYGRKGGLTKTDNTKRRGFATTGIARSAGSKGGTVTSQRRKKKENG